MATHISHAALPYPIKHARYTIEIPYLDSDGDPTDPVTPDTEISQDGGAFADAAEEVTVISGANGIGYITLTGAEMNNSSVCIAARVASGPKATIGKLNPRVLAVLSSGTLSLATASSAVLGTILPYDITGCFIRTTGGTGGGGTGGANNQVRKIVSYSNLSGTCTIAPNWETTPSTDTTYEILLPEGVTLGMLKVWDVATSAHQTFGTTGKALYDASTRPTAVEIADQVWDEATSGHQTAGTTGKALTDAGSAGDPWSTALPGAYGSGTAGKIVGDNLNATVGSRSSHSAADVWASGTRTLTGFGFTVTTSDAANIAAILADTNELQTDWVDGGRLDVILDSRATSANQTVMIDGIGFITAQLMGACADAGTAGETFQITFGGATYTLDFVGLDSTGNRTSVTRTKT